jgi:hypothetical protein
MRLGIQPDLRYLLARVGGRRPIPPERGGRRGPSVPGARSFPPGIGLRPGLGTGGPRGQVVSARCFS